MKTILELLNRFYVLLAVLGFLLIVFGVATELKLPVINDNIIPMAGYRLYSIIIGFVIIALSVFVYVKKQPDKPE